MRFRKKCTFDFFPEWAVMFAVYGEDDSLTPREANQVKHWLENNQVDQLDLVEGDVYFSNAPLFGPPCNCVSIDCVMYKAVLRCSDCGWVEPLSVGEGTECSACYDGGLAVARIADDQRLYHITFSASCMRILAHNKKQALEKAYESCAIEASGYTFKEFKDEAVAQELDIYA